MKKLLTTVFLVIAMATQLFAAPATFVDNNAALRYMIAIGFMPPQFSENAAYSFGDVNSLESLKKLKPEIRKELESNTAAGNMRTMLRLLELAALCTESTFVVDQDYDDESIIPPYRSLRTFARFMVARGWIDAEKGNYAAAAAKFAHVFRLGANLGHERFAISGMVGIGIQRMAVESINNLIEISNDASIKKSLYDYFSSLPKPLIGRTLHIEGEKLYVFNMIKKAENKPELLSVLEKFEAKSEKQVSKRSAEAACAANQRVLLGAIEMYMMDHEEAPTNLDSAAILNKLVAEQYPKSAPVCDRNGAYSFSFVDKDDFKVACSCGASPDNQTSTSDDEESSEDVSPEVMQKINDYMKSGEFAKDKEELVAIFDEIMALDGYDIANDEKAGKIAERIENSQNTLIKTMMINPQSFYKSLRENQQRIDDLVKKLAQ